jgi:hypothetical protein
MSHHRGPKSLIVAGLLIAGLAFAGAAEAIIIYDFPIFGVVNGVQTARINAVLQSPPDGDLPCPVTVVLIDSQGNQLGGPDTFQLRGGAAVHSDFIGDPGIRPGERLQIRARVTIADPNQFPGCTAGVLASVEVIDRLTRATHTILANPVTTEIRAGQ